MGMFDAPKTVVAPAKKAAKSTKAEVEIKGIEHLSMIDALQKTLETLRGTIEGEVKAIALTRFMEHIAATGQRPESFKGIEGGATATLDAQPQSQHHRHQRRARRPAPQQRTRARQAGRDA